MWLYLSALAVLLGAEFNSEFERQTKEDATEGPPKPLGQRGSRSVISILTSFWTAGRHAHRYLRAAVSIKVIQEEPFVGGIFGPARSPTNRPKPRAIDLVGLECRIGSVAPQPIKKEKACVKHLRRLPMEGKVDERQFGQTSSP